MTDIDIDAIRQRGDVGKCPQCGKQSRSYSRGCSQCGFGRPSTTNDIDAIRQQVERYTGVVGSQQGYLAHQLAKQVPALLADLAEANAEVRSVTNQLTHTVNYLAEVRRQAHRDATDHQQDIRDRYEQIARLERHIAGLETQCNEQMHAPADIPALLAKVDELTEQLFARKPVIEAAEAWAEMVEMGGDAPGDARKVEDALHDAVESYRLMDLALTVAREEKAEVAR